MLNSLQNGTLVNAFNNKSNKEYLMLYHDSVDARAVINI